MEIRIITERLYCCSVSALRGGKEKLKVGWGMTYVTLATRLSTRCGLCDDPALNSTLVNKKWETEPA